MNAEKRHEIGTLLAHVEAYTAGMVRDLAVGSDTRFEDKLRALQSAINRIRWLIHGPS